VVRREGEVVEGRMESVYVGRRGREVMKRQPVLLPVRMYGA